MCMHDFYQASVSFIFREYTFKQTYFPGCMTEPNGQPRGSGRRLPYWQGRIQGAQLGGVEAKIGRKGANFCKILAYFRGGGAPTHSFWIRHWLTWFMCLPLYGEEEGPHIDKVYRYVPAFWGAFWQILVYRCNGQVLIPNTSAQYP